MQFKFLQVQRAPEVALERQGVPFHAFPIEVQGSMALNTRFTPREAHLLLWVIEQDLMAAATGKKHELEVAAAHGDPLLETFQDFDWADEVLHARTGLRWVASEFASRAEAEAAAREIWRRYDEIAAELMAAELTGAEPSDDARAGADAVRSCLEPEDTAPTTTS